MLNVDESPRKTARIRRDVIPTLMIFNGGEMALALRSAPRRRAKLQQLITACGLICLVDYDLKTGRLIAGRFVLRVWPRSQKLHGRHSCRRTAFPRLPPPRTLIHPPL